MLILTSDFSADTAINKVLQFIIDKNLTTSPNAIQNIISIVNLLALQEWPKGCYFTVRGRGGHWPPLSVNPPTTPFSLNIVFRYSVGESAAYKFRIIIRLDDGNICVQRKFTQHPVYVSYTIAEKEIIYTISCFERFYVRNTP